MVTKIYYIARVSHPSRKHGTHYYGETSTAFYPGGVEEFKAKNGGAPGYKFFDSERARGIEAAKMTKAGCIFRHNC